MRPAQVFEDICAECKVETVIRERGEVKAGRNELRSCAELFLICDDLFRAPIAAGVLGTSIAQMLQCTP